MTIVAPATCFHDGGAQVDGLRRIAGENDGAVLLVRTDEVCDDAVTAVELAGRRADNWCAPRWMFEWWRHEPREVFEHTRGWMGGRGVVEVQEFCVCATEQRHASLNDRKLGADGLPTQLFVNDRRRYALGRGAVARGLPRSKAAK